MDQFTKRSRSVTILGWLLLFQAVGLFLISAINFSQINVEWEITSKDLYVDLPVGLRSWAFATLAFLALVTGVRFFRLRPPAWVHAMLLQGICLLMAIGLYLQERPFYTYLMMVNCIFMVVYLNYTDVLLAFRSEEASKD